MKYITFFNRALDIFNGCDTTGWDTYDAKPISKLVISNTLSLFKMIPNNIQIPNLIPNTDGTLQLEWTDRMMGFSIDISATNIVHCFFKDEIDGNIFEKDIVLDDSIVPDDILICLQHFKE